MIPQGSIAQEQRGRVSYCVVDYGLEGRIFIGLLLRKMVGIWKMVRYLKGWNFWDPVN